MINLMPTPPYDVTKFYAMCDELGRLMDAERAYQAKKRSSRLIAALSRQTRNMVISTKLLGDAAAVTGVSMAKFAEALEDFKQTCGPFEYTYYEECVPMGEDEWTRLEKLSKERRPIVTARPLHFTDRLAALAMRASLARSWLGWLFMPAYSLLEWGDRRWGGEIVEVGDPFISQEYVDRLGKMWDGDPNVEDTGE